MRHITAIASSIVVALCLSAPEAVAPQTDPLASRALQLPAIGNTEPCPVTMGRRDVVPRRPEIFGGPQWFGRGPVYMNLAWKGETGEDSARYSFSRVPVFPDGFRKAKTPWVTDPSFAGPIRIRGRSVRPDAAPILWSEERAPELRFQAPHAQYPGDWSFWASGIVIPGPGCYGVQIDTAASVDVIVFEALP